MSNKNNNKQLQCSSCSLAAKNKNSPGDKIANVNFLGQHLTCRGQHLRPMNPLPNFYSTLMRLRPSNQVIRVCFAQIIAE